MFGCAVVAWLAGGPLPLVAIAAGAAMVAIAQRDPAYAIDRVEWSLLLFFASLFVVMRGFEQTGAVAWIDRRSEEHTSELQSPCNIVCRLLLEKQNTT